MGALGALGELGFGFGSGRNACSYNNHWMWCFLSEQQVFWDLGRLYTLCDSVHKHKTMGDWVYMIDNCSLELKLKLKSKIWEMPLFTLIATYS